MAYQFTTNLSPSEFDRFAKNHPLASILQTSGWADVKKEWTSYFTGVLSEGKVIAASLVLVRRLPLGFTLFYLPRGPLLDLQDSDLCTFYFSELKQFAKKQRAISIKIDPNIVISALPYDEYQQSKPITAHPLVDVLKAYGFIHKGFNRDLTSTAQPRFAAVIYKSQPESDWRNSPGGKQARKAEKKGVEIVQKQNAVGEFAPLMGYTSKRKQLYLRNQEYYQRLVDAFVSDHHFIFSKLNLKEYLLRCETEAKDCEKQFRNPDVKEKNLSVTKTRYQSLQKEIARVKQFIAEDGDEVLLSGSLMVKDKKACYFLYSGFNDKYQRYLGPDYAQIAKLEWAFSQAVEKADFGGVPGSLDDGIAKYKLSFHPYIDEYLGEFDLPVKKWLYPLFEHFLPKAKLWVMKWARRRNRHA
ncbi:MAG: aminoacyltransferase [Erysipelotrichaceae bacterium]|nr:aminoacyltransferase [Erysipelotrichaceae bacterium]